MSIAKFTPHTDFPSDYVDSLIMRLKVVNVPPFDVGPKATSILSSEAKVQIGLSMNGKDNLVRLFH